jgi:hypothetical protein
MVPASPSLTELVNNLIVLEARESKLRGQIAVLAPNSRAYAHLHLFILRVHQEREALEQLFTKLLGVRPGRS